MTFPLLADFSLFLGRFHPLVVHLPIGFLLLAVLLEFWPSDRMRPAIRVAWALGTLSALVAALLGWLLASGGDYTGPALTWHRWLGVGVAVLAIAGIWLTRNGGQWAKAYGVATVIALSVAGHQGGNLTHGPDYLLQHAPEAVQRVAGYGVDSSQLVDWTTVSPDSINLYANLLQPVINNKCARCHNEQKQNGGLRMDEAHHLFAGGDGGMIFTAGEPVKSEWVRRVTLPRSHEKSMPPQGEVMTYTEIELLRYWISTGADTSAQLIADEVPEDIKMLLQRDYGLDLSPKLFVETVKAPLLSNEIRNGLRSLNWTLNDLAPGGPALEAKATAGKIVDADALAELAKAAPQQITTLSLDRQPLDDEALSVLPAFENLNRLRLNGTQVTSQTLAQLNQLDHLESLNLFNTQVGDEIFTHLQDFRALRRLYLWQTQVTPEAVEAFVTAHPQVAVDTGFTFTENVSKK